MTTSGVTTYFDTLEAVDVIQDAFERCGIDFSRVSGNQLDSARRSIQMCMSDWGNRGPNLWRVQLSTTALAAGQSTVTLDPNVIEVLQAYVTDTSATPPINYVLSAISRSDYAALPYPTQSGYRPNQYYFQRTTTPQIFLWQVQDNANMVLGYYAWRFQENVGAFTNQLDVPNRWYEALTSNLAWRLAVKFAPDRAVMLKTDSQEMFNAAAAEDTESVPLRITPNMSGSRWT